MNLLARLGRYFFAFSMAAFSVQYFMLLHHPESLANVPPYTVGRSVSAFFVGLGLIIAAISMASGIRAALWSRLLGAAFLLDFLIFHVARIYSNLASGNLRTRAFETLTIAGAAFVLGAIFSRKLSAPAGPVDATANFGRLLVAVSLVIFGVQHFMYHTFIASLIPAWIPARLFLAYFTGAAFLAAALSFATGKLARLAGLLLALMFFIWVVALHAPLVAHSPHSANLWSSMFVAVTMCAVGLIVAESFSATTQRAPRNHHE
ncbi:MAG TPA: hypothetical protein VN745_10320 [Verrucomicrobiae bacterium]|nr:hypothetical protein [Verrucomicrobiae bacterium]